MHEKSGCRVVFLDCLKVHGSFERVASDSNV